MEENMKLIFRGGCRLDNLGSSDVKRIPSLVLADIASTILARDYKGLGNYDSNGVIEIWKIQED